MTALDRGRDSTQGVHEHGATILKFPEGVLSEAAFSEIDQAGRTKRLRRLCEWVVLPREEGRLTYWVRTGYFSAVRVLGWVIRPVSKRPKGAQTLVNRFQYRFMRVKRIRNKLYGNTVRSMRCPSVEGLVSVVLPVHNGAAMVGEAIDSVLAQTYREFELIVVDDGSTDETPEIVDAYAANDQRVRVIHQENRRLPQALSRGFRAARGEFLTWTSDDNRMKADFLARMVDCLERRPDWDLVYANLDIIGPDGEYLHGSHWYEGYQTPPGSPHIHLPPNDGELNVWPENHVGGAFLYRDRVTALLGDFSPYRFTAEDYDYWMLVNELLTLRHADFEEPVYDYRFHDASLTARAEELGLPAIQSDLMIFDDFRRDSAMSPLVWLVGEETRSKNGIKYLARLLERAEECRHQRMKIGEIDPRDLPSLWFPAVYLMFAEEPASATVDRSILPPNCMTVLLTEAGTDLPPRTADCWDLCITAARDPKLRATEDRRQGWFGIHNPREAFTAIEIRARIHHWRMLEKEIHSGTSRELRASVVVCTYKRPDSLIDTLRSVASQSIPASDYEVLLVNNDPAQDLGEIVEEMRRTHFSDDPDRLRVVQCPLKGLSHARNAGISEARGVVVCFIDDDAVAARDWIETTLAAYGEYPDAGVVGGKILLTVPEETPPWFNPDAWRYWSYFPARYESTTEVEDWWKFPWGANWTARRDILLRAGGFRHGYGRKGEDFGAGEEVITASLVRKLGFRVLVEPRSVVQHNVDPARFTKRDLRKLIGAGLLTNYFMQRDLYTPSWQNLRNVARDLARHVKALLAFPLLTRFKRLETWYFVRGEMRLLWAIFRDGLARLSHDF
jgi:glycosyltransferase involved in cell wall biosynthesis